MNRKANAVMLLSLTASLSGCGGGGGGSSIVAPVTPPTDPFASSRTSFSGSGQAPTSSSGETFDSLMMKLDDAFDGVNMTAVSLDISKASFGERSLEIRPTRGSMSSTFSIDSQVKLYLGGKSAAGELITRGEYGTYFSTDNSSVNSTIYDTAGRRGYAGILTDKTDTPAAGKATYSGRSTGLYIDSPAANSNSYIGLMTTQFVADFDSFDIKGSSTGDLVKSGESDSTLPLAIVYDSANIESSRFQSSATGTIDGKFVPMNYRGAFFGPEAAEMGFVSINSNTDEYLVTENGYLSKE